ncbi:peptidase [Mucilaginibacter sp. PPCGB 2223]|uniref:M1 family metallopeptidase n=1 Tax=Mucilaginibacter sp. PPCGB 2223 TaxID=1886027 RepID=UPI000825F1B4|nr:M1 family metallopeptidase [Mucilaginibacter sp. PPCGB 2223]OCX50445.1 peptidase [Mucilaginibacter sp. PPCGB 2223]
MIKKLLPLITLVSVIVNADAQTYLSPPLNIEQAYLNQTRTISGKPGKNYWQNTAGYNIKISFDPQTRNLKGTVGIDYTNNSPDTLKQLWFKLYPNFYKKGVMRNYKIDAVDMSDGVQIGRLAINNENQDLADANIDGTNMALNIKPLLSKQKLHVDISYSYTLNRTSHVRTGQVDSGSYFIAYFFPRIAVYDDIDGWNKYPYLGTEEFYNDFCHFNAEITMPGNYQVWATGDLKNASEVYNPQIVKQISLAEKTSDITTVVSEADLQAGNVTTKRPFNTWRFEADNVTDFVFAASDHYLWMAASPVVDSLTGRRTRVDAVFNPAHKDYFPVIDFARKTVSLMSHTFPKWPFPYQHETVVDGLDQMEYPMMVNDNPLEKTDDAIELTDHEIFHSMFPFYMGINETKYGWMDEGWATIGEWTLSGMIDPKVVDVDGIGLYETIGGKEEDLPIITLSTQQTTPSYVANSYPKPGLGYMYVRDMLGDALFTKALHYYIEQWHGRHPIPYDFFNCMNIGAGMNLNWFWKNWFMERGAPDQAISKVSRKTGKEYIAVITNIGTKMIPIDLTVYYADGTTKLIHKDISCWRNGNKEVAVSFTADKPVERLVLGGIYDPDVDKKNNVWEVKK